MTNSFEFRFATFDQERAPRQVPTKDLSVQDLVELKKNDPFAFYSIPAAKQAVLHLGRVDLASLSEALSSTESAASDAANDGAGNVGNVESVERQQRHSFEGYPDIDITEEDLLAYSNANFDDDDEERRNLQAGHQTLGN